MQPQPKPDTCLGCPAYSWGVGYVPPQVPKEPPQVAFLGQGPGELEARYSQPFLPTAPAGEMLTRWIYQAGLQRTEVYLDNLVRCWLPESKMNGVARGNRAPTPEEARECYRRHLYPSLQEGGLLREDQWVFLVGTPVARFVLEVEKVEPLLGTVTVKEFPTP